MPELTNAKHELYARARASGLKGTASARAAGYTAVNVRSTARGLMLRPEVAARIEELKPMMRHTPGQPPPPELAPPTVKKKVKASREMVMQQLQETADEAGANFNFPAKLRALELIGKELGMFVERSMQITSPLEGLSADQLLRLLGAMEDFEKQQQPPVITITATPVPSSPKAKSLDGTHLNPGHPSPSPAP